MISLTVFQEVLGILQMVVLMVAPAEHREVGHLEAVGGTTAALQRACHGVAHVEVRLRHVGGQV